MIKSLLVHLPHGSVLLRYCRKTRRDAEKKSYLHSFGEFFRLCSEDGRLQQNLFSKSGERKKKILKIFKVTKLSIENNTYLPHTICRKCERMVESIVAF